MELITDPTRFQEHCWTWRSQGQVVALVPTMGFLHRGHLSLLEYAREQADRVVLSIFVNPRQFGPAEDLDKYPRDLEHDLEAARAAGVDLVFAPEPGAMYPEGSRTEVLVPGMSQRLCGASRPGHFCGVTTVVCKLLLLCLPHLAVFGEKDRQQLIILKRMTRDLNFPTRIVGRPTVREADGLAMSSRNVYLSPEERRQAPELYAALCRARDMALAGQRDPEAIVRTVRERIAQRAPLGQVEYVECVDPRTLEPVESVVDGTILAVAMALGRARLIDNIVVAPE